MCYSAAKSFYGVVYSPPAYAAAFGVLLITSVIPLLDTLMWGLTSLHDGVKEKQPAVYSAATEALAPMHGAWSTLTESAGSGWAQISGALTSMSPHVSIEAGVKDLVASALRARMASAVELRKSSDSPLGWIYRIATKVAASRSLRSAQAHAQTFLREYGEVVRLSPFKSLVTLLGIVLTVNKQADKINEAVQKHIVGLDDPYLGMAVNLTANASTVNGAAVNGTIGGDESAGAMGMLEGLLAEMFEIDWTEVCVAAHILPPPPIYIHLLLPAPASYLHVLLPAPASYLHLLLPPPALPPISILEYTLCAP